MRNECQIIHLDRVCARIIESAFRLHCKNSIANNYYIAAFMRTLIDSIQSIQRDERHASNDKNYFQLFAN